MKDPIVEEVRKYRQEYAAKFNYDLAAIVRDIQAREKASKARFVDLSAHRPKTARKPGARQRAKPPVGATPKVRRAKAS
jgi:hypothetical protein